MKNVDDLIDSAAALADQGRSPGEIADELNVSRETASWLVQRAQSSGSTDLARSRADDIHIDWSTIGQRATRLTAVGDIMADVLGRYDPSVTVGIEKAGVPLATTVAEHLQTDLATYAPRKHQLDGPDSADVSGTFSRNFAAIEDRHCVIVDDTITSGTTMTEAVQSVREHGGTPVACLVLADKRGMDHIDEVPVHSLLQVISVVSES